MKTGRNKFLSWIGGRAAAVLCLLLHQRSADTPRLRGGRRGVSAISAYMSIVLAVCCLACQATPESEALPAAREASPPPAIGGKFTPPAGQTLLILGQDLGSIADYKAALGLKPGGVTAYTNISETEPALLNGLEGPADWGAGPVNAEQNLKADPQAVLAIGLYIVDNSGTNLTHLADGTHDAAIDRLGAFIQRAARPVFLRIGYEFDGPWNHYEPEPFIAAWQYIVDRLRARGVTNFATVWQSATYTYGTYNDLPIEVWYPGDDYVDWMGTSHFIFDQTVQDRFLDFARAHNKPVLIAEATPQGYDLDALTYSAPNDGQNFDAKTADEIWQEWFGPFFAFIHDNADVIRAVAYINADWHSQAMWGPGGGNGYWGDSRVQVNDTIRERWLAEIGTAFWLHGTPDLFKTLGYDEF